MVCKHVNKALEKIDELGKRAIEENSSLYGHLGPYVKYDAAKECINLMSKWANETNGKGVEILKKSVIEEMGMLSPFLKK